jgi:cytochrome c oxidase subunit II
MNIMRAFLQLSWNLLWLVLAGLAAGCSYNDPQSTMNPAGPSAHEIAKLGWFIYIMFLIVAIVMWILILLVVTRPRGSFQEHAPVGSGGGQSWVLIGGFIIPVVILGIVFVTGLQAMTFFPMNHPKNEAHNKAALFDRDEPADIEITGHQWWWQVDYTEGPTSMHATTANEIHIPVGKPMNIDLRSDDVIHSFWVPTLHGKVDAVPGQVNRIRIQADHAGVYRGTCAEYCGAQHAHMGLLVVADEPEAYKQWLERQRADAAPPAANTEVAQGANLFLSKPCELCHTVRGTLAHGRTGPDLTHFGSRKGIAANMMVNDDANLSAWVVHAQALKPASQMPNITEFDGNELHAIVAYLRQLQ